MITERQLFLQHLAPTSPEPLMVEVAQAAGLFLYDPAGKKYFDLISGISVANVGHRHPSVLAAIEAQLKKYLHVMVYGEYVQSPQVQYATLLTQHLPPSLSSVYFTNSGAEATEGALKLAKRLTGRTEIVSFRHSYHGSTHGALSVLGDESFRNAFRPLLPGNRLLHFNDEQELKQITHHTAAVIMEPVQAEAGVVAATPAFMADVRRRCDETGTLLILDECQTAFGRTGTLFCFEQYGIVPDVLLLAKALGGGMPLGAFISSKENMQALAHHPALGHLTTFGGHPVSCAAGRAALNVLLEEKVIDGVKQQSKQFTAGLQHPVVSAIRSAGLLMAVAFDDAATCQRVIHHCRENGVLTDWFLFAPHCLRLAPPLLITDEETRAACHLLQKAFDAAMV